MMKPFRVVEIITGTKIVLNCGSEQGITLLKKFVIYGLTKPLFDPETKEELGQAEIIRGKGEVIHVQEKLCTVESYLREDATTRRIVKKNPLGNIWAGQPTSEEEITAEPKNRKFEDIQVGDFARPIDS